MQSKPLILLSCGLVIFAAAISIAPKLTAKEEKLKPDQLIAKHVQSIGVPEKIKEIQSRSTSGTAHVDFRVGAAASLNGQGTIVSDGSSFRIALKFAALDYPGEQFVFDGSKVLIGQINPGNRSPLGRFLYEHDELLKEGLLCGTLCTSWALLNTAARQPKLDVNGPKKVDGRSVYELKYLPRKSGGSVQSFFYFDAETFRHVRSEFRAELVPPEAQQKITDSAETTRYTLVELFGDFKEDDGLTLPHTYSLNFSVDSPRGGFVGAWTYTIQQATQNQPIERQTFSLN